MVKARDHPAVAPSLRAFGEPISGIARCFDVSRMTVSQIALRGHINDKTVVMFLLLLLFRLQLPENCNATKPAETRGKSLPKWMYVLL
ncbi:unnamed protein product [Haemonchus placei]|uniref:HTH_Tnp_IS1 domain-containing protein n=1 Tax=Haemonchus placei TaxID=6290 RepID=A0A0N4X218_HAEPC|nr:unnamed protein product [Haemonchus placei]